MLRVRTSFLMRSPSSQPHGWANLGCEQSPFWPMLRRGAHGAEELDERERISPIPTQPQWRLELRKEPGCMSVADGPTCVGSRFSGCVWCPYPPEALPQSWLWPCPHVVQHVQGWSLPRRGQGSQATVSHLGYCRGLATTVPTAHQSLVQSEGTWAHSLSNVLRAKRDVAWPVPSSPGTGN